MAAWYNGGSIDGKEGTMRQKVLELAKSLEERITAMGNVIGVLLLDSNLDPLDPYFVITLDVYLDGSPLEPGKRQEILAGAGAFESSLRKDRFLYNDLPVHIEYKDIKAYLCLEKGDHDNFLENTFALRRLVTSIILRDDQGALASLRNRLGELPEQFWTVMGQRYASRLEHAHEDMLAAAERNDSLHFIIAKAGLLESMVGALCALNKAFVCSHRDMSFMVDNLGRLPDGFLAKFRTFVSWTAEPMSRQAELAGILVRMILAMGIDL